MDCERVTEILPLFLNGTLDASEQEMVREHLAQCDQCRKELQQAAFAASAHQQHISEAMLVDYAYDRLTNETDSSLVEAHLELCKDCSEQLALVQTSRRLMDADENVASLQPQVPSYQSRRMQGWQYATIAAGIVGIIALGALWRSSRQVGNLGQQQVAINRRFEVLQEENERLRRMRVETSDQLEQSKREINDLKTQLTVISSPQANIPVIEIFPQELAMRGSSQPIQQVQVPQKTRSLTLILNSQAISENKNLSLEVVNGKNEVIWTQDGVIRQKTGAYTLNVPASLLPTGNYTLNVYLSTGNKKRKIETYRIKLDNATG